MDSTELMEQLQQLRKALFQRHFGDLDYGDTREIAKSVMKSVQCHLAEEVAGTPSEWQFIEPVASRQFEFACDFVKRLRANLNPLGRGEDFPESPAFISDEVLRTKIGEHAAKNPERWIWFRDQWKISASDFFSLEKLCDEGKESQFYWPVPDLDGICSDYLRTQGLQCESVDKLLLRAFVYKTLTEFVEQLKWQLVPPRSPLTRLVLGVRKRDALSKQFSRLEWGIALRNSTQNLISVALGVGASLETVWWAGPLVWLGTWNLFGAKTYFLHVEEQKQNEELMGKLKELQELFTLSETNFVTASYFKQRLENAESPNLRFPPAVYAILERVIAMNISLWGIQEGYD